MDEAFMDKMRLKIDNIERMEPDGTSRHIRKLMNYQLPGARSGNKNLILSETAIKRLGKWFDFQESL